MRKGGGKVGGRASIPPELLQRLERRWQETLAKPTGCRSYEELRASMGLQAQRKKK